MEFFRDKYEMFRKLNEYASSGLWDDRYNKPRLFLYGKNREKVYELHDKMVCFICKFNVLYVLSSVSPF